MSGAEPIYNDDFNNDLDQESNPGQEQELERQKYASRRRANIQMIAGGKAAQVSGKGVATAGRATKQVGGAVGEAGGQAAGTAVGAGVGAVGGAVAGGIAGLAAGGVGAIPGAMAGASEGASAGAKTGGQIGRAVGKTAGQVPGQAMEKGGQGLAKLGDNAMQAGKSNIMSAQMDKTKNALQNVAAKTKQGNPLEAGEEVVQQSLKLMSLPILNSLWSSIWLDWTSLSVWALDIYLVASLVLPIAKFGEDNILGRILKVGGASFALVIEILILAVYNLIWLFIGLLFLALVYFIVDPIHATSTLANALGGWWNTIKLIKEVL